MAQEYTITKVSEQKPRAWDNPHGGTIYYIKVMLEGHDKPVSVGKKDPEALKVGDTVYGHIEESDLPEDKFKSERRPFNQGGYQRDDMAIRAQWAIGQAVQYTSGDEKANLDVIEDIARDLFAMVERIKASLPPQDTVAEVDEEKPINLDNIPF